MGHRVAGTFNGTADTDLWICVGFVPDWIRIINWEGTAPDTIEWDRNMQGSVLSSEGIMRITGGGSVQDYAVGEGVQTYHGGETLVSGTGTAGVGTTTYGSTASRYLTWDNGGDYRFLPSSKPNGLGDASTADIDTWTMGSVVGGYFNSDVKGSYIGMGSLIIIDGKRYSITSLSANTGNTHSSGTGEVLLSHTSVPSGKVEYIGGKYTMKSYGVGEVTAAGFSIDGAAEVLESGQRCGFECGTWDI